MKHTTILCCLLLTVSAGPKDKKTTLDDIERDYLTNQKKTKQTTPTSPKAQSAAQSPTLYGFVPIKTAADYIQQEPKLTYFQPNYIPQYTQPDYSQSTGQKYTSTISQQYLTGTQQQYSTPQYTRSQQRYVPQASSQQSQRYVPQVQSQVQGVYYDNVQYLTDNSIGQAPSQYNTPQYSSIGQIASQYNTPQYVYLQQYQSPSTAVQTVVEPKGGIQYVMYIPSYVPTPVAEQTQNYANVVYTTPDAQDSSSSYQVPEAPKNEETSQYVPQKEQVQYVTQKEQVQYVPQREQVQYVPQKEQAQYVQPKNTKYNKEEYIRREPKSLLDSYIPSYVQLQYYNQAQQNSIQQSTKAPPTVRGGKQKSNYRSAGPAAAETSLTYRYQPSLYKS